MARKLCELCVAELEEVTGESNGIHQLNSGLGLGLGFPQPVEGFRLFLTQLAESLTEKTS